MLNEAMTVFEPGSGTINTALTDALGTTANDITANIGAVLPYVLAVVGLVIVITMGIRFFKKNAKA